jgi:hypothetical protein
MNLCLRRIEIVSAYLIALAAIDLSSHLINVLGLPVPQFVLGMSWFTVLAAVVVLILWPLLRGSVGTIVGMWDVAYLSTIVLWLIMEAARQDPFGRPTLTGILAWISPWALSVAVRFYLRVFGNRSQIVEAFIHVVLTVSLIHLGLLTLIRTGLPLPLVNTSEVVDRNSVSLLLVAAAFLSATWCRNTDAQPSWWLVGLIVIAFAHAELNNARAATLVLVAVMSLQLLRVIVRNDRLVIWVCVILCVSIVAVVAAVAPLLAWLRQPSLFGQGDAAVSTSYRGAANWNLLNLFLSHPWVGGGWSDVLRIRPGGYIGHTLYVNVLAAFGILGVLPLITACAWRWWWRRSGQALTLEHWMTAMCVVAVASFINDPLAWYGLVIVMPSYANRLSALDGVAAETDLTRSLRLNSAVLAGVAVVTLVSLGAWGLRRAEYVASSDIEIARSGSYALIAVEASSEAEEFVEKAVFQRAPALRDRCSVSGTLERQALVVVCKGGSEQEASLAMQRITQPILERHEQMFIDSRTRSHVEVDLDRAALHAINVWTSALRSLGSEGGMAGSASMQALDLKRAALLTNLRIHERIHSREHPTLTHGIDMRKREVPWFLVFAASTFAALVTALALAIGTAAQEALGLSKP